MFRFDHWPAEGPRFTDRLGVATPPGTRAALRRRAEAESTTVPDLLRRLIANAVGPLPRPDAH